jgi:hypothetical protein
VEKKLSLNNFRYYFGVYLEGLRKTTNIPFRIIDVPAGFEPNTSRIQT